MINPESLWNLEQLSNQELSRRCYRALYSNSRAYWHGSRTALRRKVRGFLRRRGEDREYMYSILRGVAASSLVAVALLGLDAAPALAADFMLAPNPIGGFDVGANSAPTLVDLDGDGDLDLVSGEYGGTLLYFENAGTSVNAVFFSRTGAANPFDGLNVGYYSSPTFGDLDDDGDMDLVVGDELGGFSYFENTGSSMSPAFVQQSGAANPLDGFSTTSYSNPVVIDLDDDGDLDLLAGEASGALLYFENTGTAAVANFVARTGSANPLDGVNVGGYSAPALADLDEDGDPDLTVGRYDGTFAYFENTGSAMSPTFVEQTGATNPFDGLGVGYNSTPAFADVDNDGDFDLVSGEYDGTFRLLENTTPIVNPNFVEAVGAANPLDGFSTSSYSAPVFGDLDDDGDLDVVSGDYYGSFFYFENTGLVDAPAFTELTGVANPFDGMYTGYGSTPALADIDDDGDLDLISGSYEGGFDYFENVGTASSAAFVARTGVANPFDGLSVGYSSAPALADLDGDGDLDLISGEGTFNGVFLYFENTGSAVSPTFVERIGLANPMDGFFVGGFSTPTLVDFDGDGDFDLVSGDFLGTFVYFENTGSVLAPAFELRDGPASPFRTLSPGLSSTPALADLDDDGALDLLSGESTGTFVYYVPEPQGWMALLTGSGLLAFIARKRRGRAE